jgi:broad specificity phosphatase PhoE
MIQLHEDTCWMMLIRHGATANNLQRPPRLQGRGLDDPLCELGLQQAQRTGTWLADQPIAAVYSSPLLRARQTAEAIASLHGLGVETVDTLTEADVGQWEGLSWDIIQERHPAEYQGFMTDASVHPYVGGETMRDVLHRCRPALLELMEQNLGKLIAVAAHNVVNRTFIAELLGMPLKQYRSIPQHNGGVNLLRYRDGEAKLLTLNSVIHLGDAGR